MANGLDTQVPAWLERNWTPKEPFDPSPWLAERYRRQQEAQVMPLKLQGLALQNEQTKLQIQQQAVANELQGIQLQQYQAELPQFIEAGKLAAQDPRAFQNTPMSFRNPQLQKQYVDLRRAVAETDYAITREKKLASDVEIATEIAKETGKEVARLDNGMFDPASMKDGLERLAATKAAKLKAQHPGPQDDVGFFQSKLEQARAVGDKELAALYQGKLQKLTQSTGMTIKTNPDGTMELTQGPVGGADTLTKTNLSKVQESQANALATIDIADRLAPLISNETVGAKAFAESWVKDRILAQAFPEMASGTRATAEQLAAQLRASAVKELRSDSNITEGERKQILSAIPQINNPLDSPARALDLVAGIKKMSAIRALVAAKRMGGSVPKSAALAIDDEALLSLMQQGLITPEQAKEAYRLKKGGL